MLDFFDALSSGGPPGYFQAPATSSIASLRSPSPLPPALHSEASQKRAAIGCLPEVSRSGAICDSSVFLWRMSGVRPDERLALGDDRATAVGGPVLAPRRPPCGARPLLSGFAPCECTALGGSEKRICLRAHGLPKSAPLKPVAVLVVPGWVDVVGAARSAWLELWEWCSIERTGDATDE
jgi:hypothetical protein